jgi:hypothetical protein
VALHRVDGEWHRTALPDGVTHLDDVKQVPGSDRSIAVGGGGAYQPQVVTWNGQAWKRRSVEVADGGAFASVAAFRHSAVAVGRSGVGAISARWNGERWRENRVPHAHENWSDFFSVEGLRPDSLWGAAVIAGRGVILRWDAGWRIAWRSDQTIRPYAVHVAAPGDAWVVGAAIKSGWAHPLVLRRGDDGWARARAPIADASLGSLTAIDGTPHDLWAVGNAAGEGKAAYILHRC